MGDLLATELICKAAEALAEGPREAADELTQFIQERFPSLVRAGVLDGIEEACTDLGSYAEALETLAQGEQAEEVSPIVAAFNIILKELSE